MNKEQLLESFSVNELEQKVEFSILLCGGNDDSECNGNEGQKAEICEN